MQEKFVSLGQARQQLNVARGTLRYYLAHLKIETHKFPLDKRRYIREADVERIRLLKAQAAARGENDTPEL